MDNNLIAPKHRDKPECYHAICQYSADGCSKCEYSGDCHLHFLTHMFIGAKQNETGSNYKNDGRCEATDTSLSSNT